MNIPSWLVSSVNPEKISLLVKGVASLAVLWGVDAAVVSQLQSDILSLVVLIGQVVAVVVSVYGGIRKAKLGRWSAPNYSQDV